MKTFFIVVKLPFGLMIESIIEYRCVEMINERVFCTTADQDKAERQVKANLKIKVPGVDPYRKEL